MLLNEINLCLVEQKLSSLVDTPYFSPKLRQHVRQLLSVAQAIRTKNNPTLTADIGSQLWRAIQYLDGSTTRLLPYEVVYCLEVALKEWVDEKYLITTAIIQEMNFYFSAVPDSFYTAALAHCGEAFEYKLVRIALPDLYRHKPLFSTALYHELGHFIDSHRSISNLVVLQNQTLAIPNLNNCHPNLREHMRDCHLREYFADLFAACYVGESVADFLDQFAPNAKVSITHPATEDRIANIKALLSGKSTPIIDAFNAALAVLNLAPLSVRFKEPDIKAFFDFIRPCELKSDEELHGIFSAGWVYFRSVLHGANTEWANVPKDHIERVVNDLIEKSIRNFMIERKWRGAS